MSKLAAIFGLLFSFEVVLATTDPLKLAGQYLPSSMLLTQPLTSPLNSPAICKNLWTASGWICRADETVKFAEQDASKLAQGETQYFKVLNQIKELDALFLKKISSYSNSKLKNTFKDNMRKPESAMLNSNVCWAQMGKFRNSSLCYMCSAVNYRYFLPGRGLVTFEDCQTLVSICTGHFKSVNNFLLLVREIQKFFSTVDPVFAAKIAEFLETQPAKLMHKYGRAANSDSEEAKAKVCEYTLTLVGTPLLNSIIAAFSSVFSLIKNHLETTPARLLKLSRNWEGRVLTEEDLLANIIEALITKFENNILGLVNPEDISSIRMNPSSMPMNLSMAFP